MGISSLSKKCDDPGRRGLIYALVGIHLFDVLELSIRFYQFVGLIFVREEHRKKRFKKKVPDFRTNQNPPRLSDGQNALFSSNVEFIINSTTPIKFQ